MAKHNVLCNCGWGLLAVEEKDIPTNCPVCGHPIKNSDDFIEQDKSEDSFDTLTKGEVIYRVSHFMASLADYSTYYTYDTNIEHRDMIASKFNKFVTTTDKPYCVCITIPGDDWHEDEHNFHFFDKEEILVELNELIGGYNLINVFDISKNKEVEIEVIDIRFKDVK